MIKKMQFQIHLAAIIVRQKRINQLNRLNSNILLVVFQPKNKKVLILVHFKKLQNNAQTDGITIQYSSKHQLILFKI